MRKTKRQNLIEELRYAQKLHKDRANDLELSKNERRKNKRVSQQKELIIQAIQRKIPVKKTYVRVIKRWLKIHQMWADYFEYYLEKDRKNELSKKKSKKLKEEIKEEGGVDWHKRWVKVYKKVLECFENYSQ